MTLATDRLDRASAWQAIASEQSATLRTGKVRTQGVTPFSVGQQIFALTAEPHGGESQPMRRWMPGSLLPNICLLCDQVCTDGANTDLCAHCRCALPWNQYCCSRCALPMDDIQAGRMCKGCSTAPPAFERCVAPLRYEDQPRLWVRRLKFHHGLVEARLLGTLLAEAVLDEYLDPQLPDVLVPVPLSLRRLAGRGHNQALSLATVVGRHVRRPVNRTRTTRVRHGPAQRALSRGARQSNIIGAFASRPWQGERVAVIDDVMTTGATMAALATTLLAAGASEVHAWCATRTPGVRLVLQARDSAHPC